MTGVFAALAAGAVAVGSLHALAPDHWVPFVALARARRWTTGRTLVTTALCGVDHVTVSVFLGLLGLLFGVGLLEAVGERMEALVGALLIGFGFAYAVWGLRQAARAHLGRHLPGFPHQHSCGLTGAGNAAASRDPRLEGPADAATSARLTAWSLFLIFSADPCVAVIPLLFAAAPLGFLPTVTLVVLYEIATIGTMTLLVASARAAAGTVRAAWLDRYGDAAAGGVIAFVGLAVAVLGW